MRKPWQVLLLARELTAGGTERQLAETAQSLDRSEFFCHVGCFRPGGFREEELRRAGIPVACFPVSSYLSLSAPAAALRLIGYLRRHAIQLVHAFDVPADIFATPIARAAGVPCVLSSQRAHRELTPGWTHHALRVTDLLVDGIIVNTQALRRHLIEDDKVPPTLIRLCHNGIDTEYFHPGLRSSGNQRLVIGTVCVLRPEKGLPTLLEAFARLRPVQSGLALRIIGDGPMRPELETLGRRLGIDSNFALEPATRLVAERLREIDIFVLPSLSEGLSNSLMEAMACGCVPVASRVGGNPELVVDGRTGLLFGQGDVSHLAGQLARLVENAALRQQLAQAAAVFVRERFSRQAAGLAMAAIYRRYLERPGRATS
jgi:glycosyltransferase involved in cell wall biosynthesis